MAAANTDKFMKAAADFTTAIGAGGVSDAVVTTIPLISVVGLPTDTAIEITIDRIDANGAATPAKKEVVKGVVSGTNLIDGIRGVEGTAQAHSAGAIVEVMLTAGQWNDQQDALLVSHNQDGSHKAVAISVPTHLAASKTTPVDADEIPIWNSVGEVLGRLTWANLKATLKTYFDTLYFVLTNLDTDGTLAANSDTKVASQKAVKTYVDTGKAAASYIGTSASALSTTSATMSQIGSAEVTIVTKGGKVVVSGMAPMKESVGAANAYLGIIVDGVANGSTIAFISATTRAIVFNTVLSLATGSHTIKLGYKIDSGETLTIPAYNSFVIEAFEI